VEAAGIEPGSPAADICDLRMVYVTCPTCRAVNALQMHGLNRPFLTPIDARLGRIAAAWEKLPEHVRLAIEALSLHPVR